MRVRDLMRPNGPMSSHTSASLNHRDEVYVRVIYPHFPDPEAPDDTPAAIGKNFIEAEENFRTSKFETCSMLCRKVMDLATKAIRGEVAKSETLYQRIEALKQGGIITNDMAVWAHAVRLDGNGPVHDESEISEAEAQDLLNFTQTFLLYAFTLPAMVARRQEVKTG